jgi:3-carboxy-cis,cis-muconate cycloisomerase
VEGFVGDARGGRFTDGRVPDSGIRDLFAREHRWQRWLDVESALAAAEAEVGLVPPDAALAIAHAAQVQHLDIDRVQAGLLATSHPLMALVTALADTVGEPHGGWVHWGATTQNITQTGDTLVLHEAHTILLALLADTLEAAADIADRGADFVMAGRTHGQHAVPITFGFKVAGWIEALGRHATRLRESEDRVFVALVGGAVGTFASLGADGPEVQARVADRLALRTMVVPSRAANDGFAEYVCALALLAATGGKIAGELFRLMTTEIAEATEPAPASTIGSSTMPHKQNPQLADDCVTISAQVRALVPLALEGVLHDQEVDGAHAAMTDDAVERACVLTGDLLVRLHTILHGVVLNEVRMRANLELTAGLITSETVMLALGRTLGRQQAHHIVREAALATGPGRTFSQALRADPRVTAHLSPEELTTLLDPTSHTGLSTDLAHQAATRARALAADLRRAATSA